MLIWKTPALPQALQPVTSKPGFQWDLWYAKNKKRLSEKRAKRYQEDPIYRAAALERSRQQREIKKVAAPITDGHTVAFTDAATQVGVTVWVLREWRRKSYFPEPYRRDGRLWFSEGQVQALQALRSFFDAHGVRMTEDLKPALEDVVRLTYANW